MWFRRRKEEAALPVCNECKHVIGAGYAQTVEFLRNSYGKTVDRTETYCPEHRRPYDAKAQVESRRDFVHDGGNSFSGYYTTVTATLRRAQPEFPGYEVIEDERLALEEENRKLYEEWRCSTSSKKTSTTKKKG